MKKKRCEAYICYYCQKEKGHKGKHYNEMVGEW
jgi:hypothetical protein